LILTQWFHWLAPRPLIERGAGHGQIIAIITVAAVDGGKVIIAAPEHPGVAEEPGAAHVAVDDQIAFAVAVEVDQRKADFTVF
jgi:hypothetical protein